MSHSLTVKELVEKILKHVKAADCSYEYRTILKASSDALCTKMSNDADQTNQCKNEILSEHGRKCNKLTVLFKHVRFVFIPHYEKRETPVIMYKFYMTITNPVENHEKYRELLEKFCVKLNREMLRRITENNTSFFSPEYFANVDSSGNDLGLGRAADPEAYHLTHAIHEDGKTVKFYFAVYPTLKKEESELIFTEEEQKEINEKALQAKNILESEFDTDKLINKLGTHLVSTIPYIYRLKELEFAQDGAKLRIMGFDF